MPVIGRSNFFKANTVNNLPDLPYLMWVGRISWSHQYQGQTVSNRVSIPEYDGSCSIEYDGVPASEVKAILTAYGDELPTTANPVEVTLYGLTYTVDSVQYDRSQYFYDQIQYDEAFTVTVSLKLKKQQVIATTTSSNTTPITQIITPENQKTWNFSNQEIISDSESIVRLDVGYNQAELTFDDGSDPDDNPDRDFPAAVLRVVPPLLEVLEEGDADLTTPPPNTYVLRDLTLNCDESGPKKMLKTVTRLNGQLISEEISTYGFAYLAEDINIGNANQPVLYSGNPIDHWTQIEYRRTDYYYEKPGSTTLSVSVSVPGLNGFTTARFVVAPGYEQFISIDPFANANGSFNCTFQTRAEYLTSVVTTGWSLVRLKKEDPITQPSPRNSSIDTSNPYYPFFHFYLIPLYAQQLYYLQSTRLAFGDTVDPPFRIEWKSYAELPASIQQRFTQQSITPDGQVAIIYPDPNYIEPFFIEAEFAHSNSFAWAIDPNPPRDTIAAPGTNIPGTNRQVPRPRLTTGQEAYSRVIRKVTHINPDRYTEYQVDYSSSDPGFDATAEQFRFREVSGRPPEPQTRIQEYEETESQTGRRTNTTATRRRYFISTRNATQFPRGGSVSVNATNIADAIERVKDELRLAHRQASQAQKTVTWFHPTIRSLDKVICEGDRFNKKGDWVVMSVSWNLEFKGRDENNRPLVTTSGTQLTLGLERDEPVDYVYRDEPVPTGDGSTPQPVVNAQLQSGAVAFGEAIPPLPNRRNF